MIAISIFIAAFIVLLALFIYLKRKRSNKDRTHKDSRPAFSSTSDSMNHTQAIGTFYDTHTDAFLKVYGDVIQAFRTTNIHQLLKYQAKAMELQSGMRLLDAGCGVCGPAIYFAKNYKVQVDAITASEKQAAIAKDKIKAADLSDQINVLCGDYHHLESVYQKDSYDVVYFLESFGHSNDKLKVIDSAWQVLKPGGLLYIKDLFTKEIVIPEHVKPVKENIAKINKAYCYQVGNLCDVISWLRRKGFILSSLKTIDIPLEDFENLTISNDFQELTGINRIENLQDYIFPVDFFEISCIKPWYDVTVGNSRYFLQNLYHMQVLHRSGQQLGA